MTAGEDFPTCVYCDEKVQLVTLMGTIVVFTCTNCGNSMEVNLYEKLL